MQWKASYNLYCCPLCQRGPDSHSHLFFECCYSSQVWQKVKVLAEIPVISDSWEDILGWLTSKAHSRSAKNVIGRLLVAAMAYYIWQERNNRIFSTHSRPPNQLVDLITSTVTLKLVTLRFKRTNAVERVLQAWKIPREIVVHVR